MDLYQILVKHNRIWTTREIICATIMFILIAIIAMRLVKKGSLLWWQAISGLILFVFLAVVFASTVFTRNPGQNMKYELELFWSWKKVFLEHSQSFLRENLLNCILLMPVGLLLPVLWNKKMKAADGLGVGLFISAVIETSQLIFRRGLFEWDDMIHNAIGCMIGCVLMSLFWKENK